MENPKAYQERRAKRKTNRTEIGVYEKYSVNFNQITHQWRNVVKSWPYWQQMAFNVNALSLNGSKNFFVSSNCTH